MQIIGAFSLTRHVKDWLERFNRPRILHIFDHACNLINEDRDILSIVTPQIGNGPFNLVTNEDFLFSKYLDIESSISLSDNQLNLGNFTVEIAHAQFWNPHLDWDQLHNNRDHIANQARKFSIPNSQFSNPLISNLSSPLAKADISSAKNIASKLAGLGIGLTPSGDDSMMGALYAVWIIHPPQLASFLAHEIANTAASLTTSLSAAWLKSAGRGEAGTLWHELLHCLLLSDTTEIQSAMDRILSVGATSGADALTGFLGTLMVFRELEEKYVIPKLI